MTEKLSFVQAAAKAAAAAEAASAARAAHEEACSTYTHDEVVTAVESQAHTSAEPRNLRRKSANSVRSVVRKAILGGSVGCVELTLSLPSTLSSNQLSQMPLPCLAHASMLCPAKKGCAKLHAAKMQIGLEPPWQGYGNHSMSGVLRVTATKLAGQRLCQKKRCPQGAQGAPAGQTHHL